MPSAATIASVLAIAAFSTALAHVVYFRIFSGAGATNLIFSGAGATNLLLVTLLVPATSVALGALVLSERLMARQLVGFALIAFGLAFIDGRAPKATMLRLRKFENARPSARRASSLKT